MSFTKAVYAARVARIARIVASEQVSLADGMWNPLFCGDDACREAAVFCREMRSNIEDIENYVMIAMRKAP